MNTEYFPVTIAGWDHVAWRLWCMAIPEARVANIDIKPLNFVHVEDITECKKVVVGIPGIPKSLQWEWTVSGVPLTPRIVMEKLVGSNRKGITP